MNSTLKDLSCKEDSNLESSTPNTQIDQKARTPALHNYFLEEVITIMPLNIESEFKKVRRNLSRKYSKMDWITSLIR